MASGTYVSTEDPGLKYLYLKGIITQQEYEKGLKVIEAKEYAAKPNYSVDINNGLNIRVGSKFLLKMRLLTQARYSFSTYNEAWGTIGDSRNPEILGGQVEYRAVRQQSDSSTFTVPRTRIQFLGYAFDPDLRYNFSVHFDQSAWNQEGGSGTARLLDAYVASWHIPFATVQVGQQRVWFNRALISSIATSTFADNLIVQNAFAANQVNSRDIGITILSDEDQYKFNYAIGIWNGAGTNLSREGTAVSQALPNNFGPSCFPTSNVQLRHPLHDRRAPVYRAAAVQDLRQSWVWAGRHPQLPRATSGDRRRLRLQPRPELPQLHSIRYCDPAHIARL